MSHQLIKMNVPVSDREELTMWGISGGIGILKDIQAIYQL